MEKKAESIHNVKNMLNGMSSEELVNVRSFLTQRLVEISVELELIDGIIHQEYNDSLPFDEA